MNEKEQICIEVKDWEKHFENSESRRYKSLAWVPVKNKHDGKGYRRVVQHPKSVQIFCAWSLIVQVASKMPARGLLLDDDGPLTASDLAAKTGFPESIFVLAFEVLVDPKIGWLVKSSRRFPQIPAVARQNPVNRTEQNRTEQNRTEGGDATAPEVPDVDEAVALTVNAGIPEDFVRFVHQDWASRSGKDAGGVVVRFLPYVTKRWAREQVEWRSKSHKGNKGGTISARADGVPSFAEVHKYAREKVDDVSKAAQLAGGFFNFWNDPKRAWKCEGRVIDWKIKFNELAAKNR